jgi:hypothetical protein
VRKLVSISGFLLALVMTARAEAQSFAVGAHVASSQWSEFDGADIGIGGRFTVMAGSLVGIDADLAWYPSDFPDRISFSRDRVEGLFGVTVGPQLNRVRPFAKAAVGFLKVGATPGAFACIAIFPPPLACVLAGGDTLPAFEFGGGIEIDATDRTFVRVDVTDRVLKYPGPTLDDDFERRDEAFFGHALRFTIGAGLRF